MQRLGKQRAVKLGRFTENIDTSKYIKKTKLYDNRDNEASKVNYWNEEENNDENDNIEERGLDFLHNSEKESVDESEDLDDDNKVIL